MARRHELKAAATVIEARRSHRSAALAEFMAASNPKMEAEH
jgi:hypothetical protein